MVEYGAGSHRPEHVVAQIAQSSGEGVHILFDSAVSGLSRLFKTSIVSIETRKS
jgi:hypothetical protein